MVLYEILSLSEPYGECTSMAQISRKIITGQRPALPAMDAAYQPFVALFNSCTETNQRDRPTAKMLLRKVTSIEL
jgi:hypothetical protein